VTHNSQYKAVIDNSVDIVTVIHHKTKRHKFMCMERSGITSADNIL